MRAKIFSFIARLAVSHPRKIVGGAVLLAVASAIFALASIRLNANLDDLVSEKLDYHQRYIEFLKEFGDEEYLYVVVDAAKDLPRAKQFLETLGGKIKGLPDITRVMWKMENPALEKNFLLYLTPDQLKVLKSMTTAGPLSAKNIAAWDDFAPLFGAMASRISGPVSSADEKELGTSFTFIAGLLDDMIAALERGTPYTSRLQTLFFGSGETFDPDGFLKNGDLLFLLVMPSKDFSTAEVIARPLAGIRHALDETKRDFPGIDAGLTGRPVLSADEMAVSNHDMTNATMLAIVLVALIFIFFFSGVERPLCAVTSLLIGLSWTFGFVALAVHTLNILSSVFAILLVGASLEYSIYIVARYQEELAQSGDVSEAIAKTLATTGMANVTSALTTAAAFCTLMWTDFLALRQLGMISAMGIVLCLAAMIVVLPALLALRDGKRSPEKLRQVKSFTLAPIAVLYRKPSMLLLAALLITITLLPWARRISFDNNLLNLQPQGLESVKYEHLIIEKSRETTWFARTVADTVEESHRKTEAFRALASVRGVDDIEKIVPEDQLEKKQLVQEMAPAFAGLTFTAPLLAVDRRALLSELGRLTSNLSRLTGEAFSSGRVDAVVELDVFSEKVKKLVSLIGSASDGQLKNLGEFQAAFFADLQKQLALLATGMHPTNLALQDLPHDLADRFVSHAGRYALFIYPKENIWDPQALATFVTDIRAVDPQSVGTPIEVHESSILMRHTFMRSALLALVVIFILVWLDFRTLRAALLAMTPLVFGLLWLFGVMGLGGIQLNMANFFAIPILMGTGVNFGVQVMHRLRQERSCWAISTSTGKGLLMTAIANGVGFGMMMMTRHRGMASLGKILALGCIICCIASLIVTPPLARWLHWGHKQPQSS